MTHGTPEPGGAQAGEYLLQIAANQDRLRRDQVLAGKAGQLLGDGHRERAPGRPVWKSDTGWRHLAVSARIRMFWKQEAGS